MTKVLVREDIQAAADEVWETVRDFGGIMKWSTDAISGVSVEGEGIGAVRTIEIAGGASIQEKLEAYDDAARSFSYSFTGKVLLPIDDYYATMTIVEAGPDRCTVEWSSTFEPKGIPEKQAVGMVEGIYHGGIAGLKSAVE